MNRLIVHHLKALHFGLGSKDWLIHYKIYPLISGIYSSVNSEDESSDRDMVQNSLGGFLYGGPIGAIAGFGNWVFNKLFDKTPTEFALDMAGISKIWKGKKMMM